MKYCLYAYPNWLIESYGLDRKLEAPISHKELPPIMHSGLTNWARVFDGKYDDPRPDDYKQYDVIHVNMTMKNIGVVKRLKDRMSGTKGRPMIVVNPDYAIEMWENYQRLDLMLSDIDHADRIFCVHPVMSRTLETFLERKVYTIPHPTDVETLQQYRGNRERDPFPAPVVIVLIHPYDQNYLLTTFTLRSLKKKYPELQTIMIGRCEKVKPFLRTEYNEVYDVVPFPTLMELVSRANCVIDTATTHSYGRIGVECAAVGTPCYGDSRVESIRQLHYFDGNILDGKTIYQSVDAILSADRPITHKADPYSYESSKSNFMEMINDA